MTKTLDEIYLKHLRNAVGYYHSDELFIKYFGRVPKQRDVSFKYCLERINQKECPSKKIVLELGTSRSFTDGRFPGCNLDDTKFWEPDNPEKWDWSAGCFTKFFSELTDDNTHIITVDLEKRHIERCKVMTQNKKDKITYIVNTSENILNMSMLQEKSVSLLYLDTGDMTPIEPTAQLHLREAKIIVERNILKDDGLILIDDVRNCCPKENGETSDYGKAKYSIPYFLENGYKIVVDEYQVVLQKS